MTAIEPASAICQRRSLVPFMVPTRMMLDRPMIDVAIGLAFFYVTLSLVCSSIQEIIAGVFGLRSRNLKRGIENLVGNEYARALYDHPLIKGLRKPNRLPSYLNAEIFGAALIEVVAQDQASKHALPVKDQVRATKSVCRVASGPWRSRPQAVDVLLQRVPDMRPHRIENEVDPLAPC